MSGDAKVGDTITLTLGEFSTLNTKVVDRVADTQRSTTTTNYDK
ncbi:hypothetical protein ACA545_02140 [Vibrio cholerae]